MNFTRRSKAFEQIDDSFVISDSDDENQKFDNSRGNKSSFARRPKKSFVIAESDSDPQSENSSSNPIHDSDGSEKIDENSEDEDIRFMNQSHQVSIIEDDSCSESDAAPKTSFAINKLKRRSIYDTPLKYNSPKSESTPINSHVKKKVKPNTPNLESSGDFSRKFKERLKKKNPLKFSDDEDDVNDENDDDISDNEGKNPDSKVFKHGITESQNKNIEKNNEKDMVDIHSSINKSENESTKLALEMAKKEIGVGNIDTLEAQKREELLCGIQHHKEQFNKLERLTRSTEFQKLPDKGVKVIQVMKQLKEKIECLTAELTKLNRNSSFRNKSLILGNKSKTETLEGNIYISSDENKENSQTIKLPVNRNVVNKRITISSSEESEPQRTPIKIKNLTKKRNSIDLTKPELVPIKNRMRQKSVTTISSSDDNSDDFKKDLKSNERKSIKTNNNFNYSEKMNDFNVHDIPNVPLTSFQVDDLGKKALETLNKQQTLTHKRLEQLHGSLTSRPTEDFKVKDPYGLNIQLMDHQKHGLAWMMWRETQKPKGGILADDMGLGKTLSMISLILTKINEKRDTDDSSSDDEWFSKKKNKRYYGGTLVICPASLIKQWEAEVKNRCKRGLLTVLVFHGNNRSIDDRKLSKYSIVVTTYQTIVREAQGETGMYKMEWNRIILDEAHYIRNHKSKACEAVCGLNAKYKWALSGTPIQNKEMDLYAILKFLRCSPFDDLVVWKRWVDNKNEAGKQRLITIMKTMMLRRTKQELQSKGAVQSLPEKDLKMIEISLDREENLVYQKILLFSQNLFAQFLAQRAEKQHLREMYGGGSYSYNAGKNTQFTKAQKLLLDHHSKTIETHEILVLLLRLRQMCCHPALIHAMLDRQDVENNGFQEEDLNVDLLNKLQNMSINDDEEVDEHAANYKIDQRVAANLLTKKNSVFDDDRLSSKVRAVMKTVEEIIEQDDKLIIVSQWSSFLKVIAKNLDDLNDAKYAMFTGEVAVKDRQRIVDELNDPRSDVKILLLSLTAGGVGLNLVGANHLLLIDIHWNPQLEQQAQDRIYRFGQKKNVHVYKFICKETIEERVKALQDKKLSLAQDVLTGTRTVSSKLTIEDLKSLFS